MRSMVEGVLQQEAPPPPTADPLPRKAGGGKGGGQPRDSQLWRMLAAYHIPLRKSTNLSDMSDTNPQHPKPNPEPHLAPTPRPPIFPHIVMPTSAVDPLGRRSYRPRRARGWWWSSRPDA